MYDVIAVLHSSGILLASLAVLLPYTLPSPPSFRPTHPCPLLQGQAARGPTLRLRCKHGDAALAVAAFASLAAQADARARVLQDGRAVQLGGRVEAVGVRA